MTSNDTRSTHTEPPEVLGRPPRDTLPWSGLPFPSLWVTHLPALEEQPPFYLATAYGSPDEGEGGVLWLDAFEALDDALIRLQFEMLNVAATYGALYRYTFRNGTIDGRTKRQDAVLFDGLYRVDSGNEPTWISAEEFTSQNPIEKIDLFKEG